MNLYPKLIFFDIDGTLLNSAGEYSLRLKQEMLRLKDCGVKLAIASGRPAIAAQFLFDDLPVTDAGLFCTGAEIYHPSESIHLKLHPLEKTVTQQFYNDVEAVNLYCEFYTTEFYAIENPNELTRIHSQHLRVTPLTQTVGELFNSDRPITKLLLGAHEASQGAFLKVLAEKYKDHFEFAFAHFLAYPGWLFTSVISRAADKNNGFDWLLEYHQVAADEVMSFGDSHSDRVFLQRAGVGVAMGNALPEIKAVADTVTNHCDEDGVATFLAKLHR